MEERERKTAPLPLFLQLLEEEEEEEEEEERFPFFLALGKCGKSVARSGSCHVLFFFLIAFSFPPTFFPVEEDGEGKGRQGEMSVVAMNKFCCLFGVATGARIIGAASLVGKVEGRLRHTHRLVGT